MKRFLPLVILILCSSCEYFGLQSKIEKESEQPIAKVYNANLYRKDIESLLPVNISKKDSLVFVKGVINSWAKQQLLLQKAEENTTEIKSNRINDLVQKYRESLFINDYKERLIKQQLDTIISEDEIIEYYNKNKENFKLNEELLQLKYIHLGTDFVDKNEVIKQFKSDKEEDLEQLEKHILNFKSYRLRDSTWMPLDKVLLKITPFQQEPKEKLLKISKYIQKEDSLGLYLVAVKKVLKRNDVAPISYITPTIKQLILHKRKIELIREIEKTLINDAIQNKHFKEY